MPLRATKTSWTLSEAGMFKYRGPVMDPDSRQVLQPGDIVGVTAPPLKDEEIEWEEGEMKNGQPVMYEVVDPYTGIRSQKQKSVRKTGSRIERLKELGLFEEINPEREDYEQVTTAEDRVLAEMEKQTGLDDQSLLQMYKEAGVRSPRNKIDLLERLINA